MTWEDQWLVKYNKREIPNENVFPNVSVFNRKLYTFGGKEEVYIKFDHVDDYIKSYDELALWDTNLCMFRVSENDYIVVSRKGEKYAVIGKLSDRYVKKNDLNQYDAQIRNPDDYELITLPEIFDNEKELTYDLLSESAEFRVKARFDAYMNDVKCGYVPKSQATESSEVNT